MKVYELSEVAEILGMSERWVRDRCKSGVVHTRLGHKIRFTQDQLDAFVAEHATTPIQTSITTGRKRRAS